MAIPKGITKALVIEALEYIDNHPTPKAHQSVKYHLNKDGKTYPPKWVIAVARHLATREKISTDGFNAVEAKNWLTGKGYEIQEDDIPPGDIKKEQDESSRYELDETEDQRMVKLTLENVAKVEAMIKNDSAYIRASDPTEGPAFNPKKGTLEYSGSTPFWISLLKQSLEDANWTPKATYGRKFDRKDKIGFTYEEIIAGAIAAIDRDNSTHLTGDGVGRIAIWERICKMGRKQLKDRLQRRDFDLVNEIMARTDPGSKSSRKQLNSAAMIKFSHKWLLEGIQAKEETKNQNNEFKPRTNQSFASKFCHYVCRYVFEGKKEADNFSIYDKVLVTVLPQYWEFFGEPSPKKKSGKYDYKEYSDLIDLIRKKNAMKTGYMISRNGLDHLLWYYHKGRLGRRDDEESED